MIYFYLKVKMENQINIDDQNSQQVGQNPVNQPVITPEKPKTNYLMIGGIVLVCFVLFGFGGYYLGKQSLSLQQIQPTPTIAPPPSVTSNPTVTPTNILNPTQGWETYRSSAYTLKHPDGLKSDTGATGAGVESIRFQFMGPKQIASGRTQTSLFDGYSFVVTKVGLATEKTAVQRANEARSNTKDNCGAEVILSEIKEIQIGNSTGIQYSVKNCMGDYTNTFVTNGGYVYEITQLYTGDKEDQQKYEEITNQIFSTFRFL